MIFTSSFGGEYRGDRLSISQSVPEDVPVSGSLAVFFPSAALIRQWEESAKDQNAWNRYSDGYAALLKIRKAALAEFKQNPPKSDATLVSADQSGPFSYRRLVAEWLERNLPELWGGELDPQKSPQTAPSLSSSPWSETDVAEDTELFQWAVNAEMSVPQGFQLHPHVTVSNPALFAERLKGSARRGLRHLEGLEARPDPRQRTGALQKDLVQLRKLLGS